ncbi:MAG: dihydroorotate dehydrogenase electron transfer subunit [Bacteroidetes bacterium]|nr:dihydroorotate dehydrogenase electron transfer subunit [Bacteroidota bacterium]
MNKIIQDFEVSENLSINNAHFILKLNSPSELPKIFPGQFAQVLIPDEITFLRRPFSIHDVNFQKNAISLFIKCVGEGTSRLRMLKKGDFINILFPLGNSFGLNINSKALLIGDECGIAPLYYLAKCLHEKKIASDILIGAKSRNDIFLAEEFGKFCNVYFTTEDGSFGEKGLVRDHSILKNILSGYSKIYCSGSEQMIKAIASMAKMSDVDCEVSLEKNMACGIGACLCCVTETVDGRKCVCTDGPVFNIKSLKWQI